MEVQEKKVKKKLPKIEDMSKDQIRQAILKKRGCNAKAQTIVENLLEKNVTEVYFLNCLPDINQSHFEDVIEERSILHICGYPLCEKTLSVKDIPKQKYRISLKTNKVYDITTRKNFCSNGCYKSAMHVKKQMLTSPLWFREYEDIPKFDLHPMDSVGSLGQEVDLKIIERIDVRRDKQMYTSINDFASASLNEITGDEPADSNSNDKENIYNDIKNIEGTESSISDIKEPSSSKSNRNVEQKKNINTDDNLKTLHKEIPVTTKVQNRKPVSNPLNIVGEIIEKPERKIDPIITREPNTETAQKLNDTCKKAPQKKQPSITAFTIEVEKCLAEWFTLDTLIFLFGEEKVKEIVVDKGECIKQYFNNYGKSLFYTSNTYDQYQALCRKLNMLELEDKKYDAQTLHRETKPLPDYSVLQEESKKMELKVKAFLAGELEVPEPKPEEITTKTSTDEVENPTQLPLVDKNAQNALRRRIVCQHLNKVLPDLLRSLGLSTLTVSADIRLLVNTFKLKANNIMFKPIQWTLIAIVFIKLLSIRDKRLEYLLEQPTGFQHMQLLLLSFKQDGSYLDRLISWLTDIDRMLDLNDTHLTIE
ncbi:putative RNA polymerase II subunit B1 CTD phosphatase RPAP2 [Epargyreus clarus]|uniref:putative RNA polymerase II subunit B1 CTD phosphatase RPAP2 n=1 Tax=Epargyreus clarus TaxID=520877 RepID=UPI003C2E654C